MDRERLKARIRLAEGFSQRHWDVKQYSGGYGHKLPESWPPDEPITQEQAEDWLDDDITVAVGDVGRLVDLDAHDEIRQEALVEMAFQMGYGSFNGFRGMIGALNREPPDYCLAAIECLDSELGRSPLKGVRKRARRYADMIRLGDKFLTDAKYS